ncbi:MAG TPA: pYEATS domain-containing protein, partial [Bradyrhizobium sp.]|nr:pYEATS domain-containing protein [Bradyrhizobium sp.]
MIELVAAFVAQIRSGASLKVGAFELKGISREAIEKDLAGSHLAHAEPASAKDVDDRQNEYVRLRGLMLVHRIRPVLDEPGHFDISVYLLPHKGGALNQVKKVEYYFGPHWGGSQNGSRFVVEDPRDGFAMKIQAYGPALCMADILFHDKEQVISRQFRYLDFEMADAFRSQDS